MTQRGPAEAVAAAASGKKKQLESSREWVGQSGGGEMTEDSAVWRKIAGREPRL